MNSELVTDADLGLDPIVVFVNGNKMDCRDENLRMATEEETAQLRKKHPKKKGNKGKINKNAVFMHRLILKL